MQFFDNYILIWWKWWVNNTPMFSFIKKENLWTKNKIIFDSILRQSFYISSAVIRRIESLPRRRWSNTCVPSQYEYATDEYFSIPKRPSHIPSQWHDTVHEPIGVNRPGMGSTHIRCQFIHPANINRNWCKWNFISALKLDIKIINFPSYCPNSQHLVSPHQTQPFCMLSYVQSVIISKPIRMDRFRC